MANYKSILAGLALTLAGALSYNGCIENVVAKGGTYADAAITPIGHTASGCISPLFHGGGKEDVRDMIPGGLELLGLGIAGFGLKPKQNGNREGNAGENKNE